MTGELHWVMEARSRPVAARSQPWDATPPISFATTPWEASA